MNSSFSEHDWKWWTAWTGITNTTEHAPVTAWNAVSWESRRLLMRMPRCHSGCSQIRVQVALQSVRLRLCVYTVVASGWYWLGRQLIKQAALLSSVSSRGLCEVREVVLIRTCSLHVFYFLILFPTWPFWLTSSLYFRISVPARPPDAMKGNSSEKDSPPVSSDETLVSVIAVSILFLGQFLYVCFEAVWIKEYHLKINWNLEWKTWKRIFIWDVHPFMLQPWIE